MVMSPYRSQLLENALKRQPTKYVLRLKPHIKEAMVGKQVYLINFSNCSGDNSAIPDFA